MFFVAGITGHVGGAAARNLLDDGHKVRALVRDRTTADEWSRLGVEVRGGDLTDASAVADALEGVEGAFLMLPSPVGVSPEFPEAKALNASIVAALDRSPPPRLVVLSSVGSEQASGIGNVTQTHMLEEDLADVAFPVAFVRAGGLFENYLGLIDRAAETGVLDSFLQPVERSVPMVATRDVGVEVARLLTGAAWKGRRIIELGSRISPNDIADGLGKALGREVVAQPIPREHWEITIEAMGVEREKVGNYAEMEDGLNSGWIDFGRSGTEAVAGTTTPALFFAEARGQRR